MWLASFCLTNTIYRKPTPPQPQQYNKWPNTTEELRLRKECSLKEKISPKSNSEQMIFSLLHGVLVQATPINDNGS